MIPEPISIQSTNGSDPPEADPGIRVVLADPDELLREGLRHLLAAQPGIEVVGSAATGEAAAAACHEQQAELVLLAWQLADMDAPALLRRLAANGTGARAIILADAAAVSQEQAIQAGAWGYLTRHASVEATLRAIRAVAHGELWASRGTLARVIRARVGPAAGRQHARSLSSREAEVLGLVAAGLTNEQIAARLFVELSTVKTHLIRAYRKLGVSDRTAAVMAALRAGVIDPTPQRR